MARFSDYLEPCMKNDIIIQKSLRDIDAEVMVSALHGMEEAEREMVYRNMSVRACKMIKVDLEATKDTPPATVKAACEFFLALLEKHTISYVEPPPESDEPPAMDLSSNGTTIESFVALSRFALRKGLLSLESVKCADGSPLLKEGLSMLAEGWDPLLIRSIMDNYKAAYLRSMETRLDLLISGIESVASKDSPNVTEQKLRALVAEF